MQQAPRRSVVRAILAWYRRHGRTLPWRNTSHPYRILVSEIMLQQTQVRRVLVKYRQFLRRFPTLRALAWAERRDVIVAWRGMGYNVRAVRLHECARLLLHKHGGKIPTSYEELLRLPGIGPYTANALLVSVHRSPVAVVDVNIRRVLSRIFWRMSSFDATSTAQQVDRCAAALLPQRKTYEWTQALMDLGAMICTARVPRCSECPVAFCCLSRRSMKNHSSRRSPREPQHDGVPNRIYRGRIIEHLRRHRKSLPAVQIARRVHPKFTASHERWFVGMLNSLERDGLIRIRGNGSLTTMRVSLA